MPTPATAPTERHVPTPETLDLAARVAMLETQSAEQGAALRRVLGLLVDWVEHDDKVRATPEAFRAPLR